MRCYESAFSVALGPDPVSLAMARQQCHDQVIENTGATRRSGVVWTHHITDDAPGLGDRIGGALPEQVLQICAMFPGHTLVMATVEVEV